MPRTLEATAPTRVDLAGGTLDIWPIYLMLDGAVTVNLGLALPTRARVSAIPGRGVVLRSRDHGTEERFPSPAAAVARARHRLAAEALRAFPAEGIAIETASGVPPGSGLGGSSSMSVALLAALGRRAGARTGGRTPLALFASNVEGRVIQVPPGSQDHLAAAWGGLSAWHYGPGGVERRTLRTDPGWLARRLVLAYTGVSHSSVNNWRVTRAFLDRDRRVRRGFAEVAAASIEVRDALDARDLPAVAAGMDRDSRARRRLFPGFHTARTLSLARAARRAGAAGGRPCGAGGGGSMVFVVEDAGHRASVEASLARLGATILPVVPDLRGVRVRESA